MADSLFQKSLAVMIEQEIADIKDTLATGSCENHGEYKERCGVIQGLNIALNYSIDVKKQILGE